MTPEAVTLSQLASHIKGIIDSSDIRCWVVAEIQSVSYNRHCYLELIENSDYTGRPIAQMRCNIWANTASSILPRFEADTGQKLAAGMKVMVFVEVHYHELYGLSGNVTDINSEFTLGDMERRRRETLARLEEDGVIDLNKQLPIPLAIKRIAVISSSTAAGYGDFMNQLNANLSGLAFDVQLYQATMQGNEAPQSIINALQEIANASELPDIVVIIRGGGSRSDLLCFDDYELALCIAMFPCPIVTGIGHERDNSVCDIVACVRVKTPTAAAEFIISHNEELLNMIMQLHDRLRDATADMLQRRMKMLSDCRNRLVAPLHSALLQRTQRLERVRMMLKMSVYNKYNAQLLRLGQARLKLQQNAIRMIHDRQQRLDNDSKAIMSLNPTETLKRGYTLTTVGNRRVSSSDDVIPGDVLDTYFADGKIVSVVQPQMPDNK